MPNQSLYFLIAYVLIIAGVAGSLLPALPGVPMIWLGELIWAWADGFRRVGWPVILLLGGIALVSFFADKAVTTSAVRRAGASWTGVAGTIVGGIIGAIMLSPAIPIVGTIIGALAGGLLGLLFIEIAKQRSLPRAGRAAVAFASAYFMGMMLQVFFSLAVLSIFVWAVLV